MFLEKEHRREEPQHRHSYSLAFLPYSFLSHSSRTGWLVGFSWREPDRTTAAPGRSAKPGVPRLEEEEVRAGEGPELFSLGVVGAEGVPESELKLNTEALGVGGVGGGKASILPWICSELCLEERVEREGSLSIMDILEEAEARAAKANPFPLGSLVVGENIPCSRPFGVAEVLRDLLLLGTAGA